MVYIYPLRGRDIQSELKAKLSDTISTTVIERSGCVDIKGTLELRILSEILSETNIGES